MLQFFEFIILSHKQFSDHTIFNALTILFFNNSLNCSLKLIINE
ncbi:MAG: hypothetical protein Q8S84_00340 [bacterium]|nr:hypothetical protein [bacterium]MDP3380038.1 hypothetical protein [bacterium]